MEQILNLRETLTSGQCFRATQENNTWTILSGIDQSVQKLTVSQDDMTQIHSNPYWHNFFDMDTDYSVIIQEFNKLSPILKKACEYAPGIRILNQNPWESLCSFVISQNNNIKRITSIIQKICEQFGKTDSNNRGFPCADTLAGTTESQLKLCGVGFRAQYIINTATAVCKGKIDFQELKTIPINDARKILMEIKGIGPKVADCALLFGCHRLDCFPMDTWMKKVMATFFPSKDASFFGKNAGIAQQYLFHYIRTSNILNNN